MKTLIFTVLFLTLSCAGVQRPVPVTPPALRVSMEVDLGLYHDNLKNAMEWWNNELGCNVFDWGHPSDVHVMKAEKMGNILAIVWKRGSGFLMTVHSPETPKFQQYIFVHELGHVLGLEHDKNRRNNIMYPYAKDANGFIIGPDSTITDGQRSSLRTLYCK